MTSGCAMRSPIKRSHHILVHHQLQLVAFVSSYGSPCCHVVGVFPLCFQMVVFFFPLMFPSLSDVVVGVFP